MAIENEKLDLELAIAQLKKENEQLSQSLKRRKDLAIQMNDHLYIEERIKDLHPSSNLDEAIMELLEKSGFTARRSEKTKKRERNLVSKAM